MTSPSKLLRHFVAMVALVTASAMVPPPPVLASHDGDCTDDTNQTAYSAASDPIKAWSVNIRLDYPISEAKKIQEWTNIIESMKGDARVPDVAMVQEITAARATRFVTCLESGTGQDYMYAHTSAHGGNEGVMVLWRTARFAKVSSTSVSAWAEVTDSAATGWDCSGSAGAPGNITVHLNDSVTGKEVVVASVDWNPGGSNYSNHCVYENMERADFRLEDLAPVRPLTILGGDFNKRVDKRDPTRYATSVRMEARPACWYIWTMALYANDTCKPAGSYTGSWYDTVGTRQFVSYDSATKRATSNTAICSEWTHPNKTPARGVSPDDCSALAYKRIDHIWARWETSTGAVIRDLTPAQAQALIPEATADKTQGYATSTRYSDHRAVKATIRYNS